MTKYLKRFLVSSFLLLLFILGSAYIFFPSLFKMAIQHKLPASMTLEAYKIHRPTVDGIFIENIRFGFDHSPKDHLTLKQLDIKLSWFQLAIADVNIQSIELALSEMPQQQPNKDSVKATPLSEFNFPQTTIHSAKLSLDLDNFPTLELQAKAEISNTQLDLKADLTSSTSISGHLAIQSSDWLSFQLDSEINDFDLALLGTFQQYVNLPLDDLSGQLDAKLNSLFDWQNNRPVIQQLLATMSASGIYFKHQDNEFEDINGKLTIVKDQQWRIKESNFTGTMNSEIFQPKVQRTKFPFELNLKSLVWEKDNITTEVSLDIEPDLKVTASSRLPLSGKPSHHLVTVEVKNIDELWSDKLDGFSIAKTYAQFEFDLNTLPSISLANMNSKNIRLESLKYDSEIAATIESIKTSIQWQPKFKLTENPFQSLHFIADNVQLTHKASSLNTQFNLDSDIKFSDSNQQFKLSIKHLEEPKNDTSFDIEGSIMGTLSDSGMLEAKIATTSTIKKIRRSLSRMFPKRKMLKDITVNQGQPFSLNAQLNSRLDISSKTPLKTLKLNGEVNTKVDQLQMGKNRFNHLTMQVTWQPSRPWHRMAALVNTKLNYLNIDQQSHNLKLDLDLIPNIQLSTVDYQAKLLGGSITASTPEEFLAIDNLKGQIKLDAIDLERISQIMGNPQLFMQGSLSGSIPFAFKDKVLIFENGQLTSTDGRVEYLPEGKKLELTQDNVSQIANITLQNFHYQLMDVQLLRGSPCEFDFKIRLEGKNPDLGGQQSQAFNINYNPISNVNLYYLLLLGKDNIKDINQEALHSGCIHNS